MPVNIGGQAGNDPRDLTPSEFARLFRLKPEEAIGYLERRAGAAVTFDWRDLWQDEHAKQFTVSRLARLDIVEAMQKGILDSVNGDLSRRDWSKDVKALLAQAGWWGEKEVLDPVTGKLVKTVFDPARLKLIYDTNTNMAYQAGLWERIQRNKATSPYLRYITKRDERVRITHQAWDNITLPVDDPWLDTHYPPNGWRCRCRAMSMSQKQYDEWAAQGRIKTDPPPSETKRWVDKRSGEVHDIPVGIDPGFAYNVGQASAQTKALVDLVANKLEAATPELAAAALPGIVASEMFARWMARPDGNFPLVRIPAKDAEAIGAKRTVAVISPETAAKQLAAHPELTSAEYAAAQAVVDSPTAKSFDSAKTLLYIQEEAGPDAGGHVLVVKATLSGEGLFVTSYRRLSRRDALRDAEVARLLSRKQKK